MKPILVAVLASSENEQPLTLMSVLREKSSIDSYCHTQSYFHTQQPNVKEIYF